MFGLLFGSSLTGSLSRRVLVVAQRGPILRSNAKTVAIMGNDFVNGHVSARKRIIRTAHRQ